VSSSYCQMEKALESKAFSGREESFSELFSLHNQLLCFVEDFE
jgi:hypothetical protein